MVDDDDGMEDDLRQFYILDMLQFGNASGKLPLKIGWDFFIFVTFNSSHRKMDSFSGCQKSF